MKTPVNTGVFIFLTSKLVRLKPGLRAGMLWVSFLKRVGTLRNGVHGSKSSAGVRLGEASHVLAGTGVLVMPVQADLATREG
jgi:hypothetical protein